MTSSPSSSLALLATWQERIQQAAAQRTRLAVVGGGSKSFLTPPPPPPLTNNNIETLSTQPLQHLIGYEPSELVVTVEAGYPLQALEEQLAEHGQHLASEPPNWGSTTVGGAVITGFSGPARVSRGGLRDHVLGMQGLNGLGETLRFGGQVMKNVAGYDIARLWCGSWGRLGVLTQISLKVHPIAKMCQTIVLPVAAHEVMSTLQPLRQQALPLDASVWQDTYPTPPTPPTPPPPWIAWWQSIQTTSQHGCLALRFQGTPSAVRLGCERALAQVKGSHPMPYELQNDFWQAFRHQNYSFFHHPPTEWVQAQLWRVSLPLNTPPLNVTARQCWEWHGALRWMWIEARHQADLIQQTHALGGHCRLWRQASTLPTLPIASQSIQPIHELNHRILAAFDPHGVFSI